MTEREEILDELLRQRWAGQIAEVVDMLRRDERYQAIEKRVEEAQSRLLAALPGKREKLFWDLDDAINGREWLSTQAWYSAGLKDGVLVGALLKESREEEETAPRQRGGAAH